MAKKKTTTKKRTAKKNQKVLVAFVLDETGSMFGIKDDTIGGFNEYIKTLGERKGGAINFALTTFNSGKCDAQEATPIAKVKELTNESYNPAGMTPLYDAVGRTIRSVEENEKEWGQVIFVIMTDGAENYSREFTKDGIFKLIEEKKKAGWTFAFMGAGEDAYLEGSKMGMAAGSTMKFDAKDMKRGMAQAAGATLCCLDAGTQNSTDFWSGGK